MDVLSDCERLLFFRRFEDEVLLANELKFVLGTVMILEVVGEEGMAMAPLLRIGGDCRCGCDDERTSELSVRACGIGEGRVELGLECISFVKSADDRGLSGANKGNAARFGALFGALVTRDGILMGKLFGCT